MSLWWQWKSRNTKLKWLKSKLSNFLWQVVWNLLNSPWDLIILLFFWIQYFFTQKNYWIFWIYFRIYPYIIDSMVNVFCYLPKIKSLIIFKSACLNDYFLLRLNLKPFNSDLNHFLWWSNFFFSLNTAQYWPLTPKKLH
jgi:hypothetical protein